ncbi:hypothetical protein GGD61_005289 [Bradyrhizobium sp. SBR1B]|nr:hypothetical protein [Bradyrhizobium sp. SBR1B]
MATDIAWVGSWRNQFGSILPITDDANRRLPVSRLSAR